MGYIGNNKTIKLYKGSNQINKMCIGETIYYGNNNTPPVHKVYEELSLIETTGTQWIDLNFTPTKYIGIKTKIIFKKVDSNDYTICGSQTNTNGKRYGIGINPQNRWQFGLCNGYQTVGSASANIEYNIEFNYMYSKKFMVNNQQISTLSEGTYNTGTLYIFSLHHTSPIYFPYLQMFYLTLYDETGLELYNLVPCKRISDNVLGMLDTVNNTFYTNSGTGTFIAGSSTGYGYDENGNRIPI